MLRKYLYIFLGGVLVLGCVPAVTKPPKTQLEIREFQTRTYETNDSRMVMKSLLNVLQDDGYITKNADAELGFLSAVKEIDVESKGEALILTLFGGKEARWKKNSIIECSCNVGEFGKLTRVRVNFQLKVMDNKGAVMQVETMEDAKFYQEFFAKVDKGIYIAKQRL